MFGVDGQRAQWLPHDHVDRIASLPTTPHRGERTWRDVLGFAVDRQRRPFRHAGMRSFIAKRPLPGSRTVKRTASAAG